MNSHIFGNKTTHYTNNKYHLCRLGSLHLESVGVTLDFLSSRRELVVVTCNDVIHSRGALSRRHRTQLRTLLVDGVEQWLTFLKHLLQLLQTR